jgi:YfiH family protein
MPTPEVADGFAWSETPDGRVLVAQHLQPVAPHAFTTRSFGGVPPSPSSVLSGLAGFLAADPQSIVRVRQVHGCDVMDVVPGERVAAGSAADALLSTDPMRPVAVAVADCVPVLLADRRGRAVAAVHAGWRGTAAGIVASAVTAFHRLGVEPRDLVAAIGPSIGPCCYQVDVPVRGAMLGRFPQAPAWFTPDGADHWRLDLWRANADQLVQAGLAPDAVSVARFCTAHHLEECFSYRREGAGAGRLFGAIRLRPQP